MKRILFILLFSFFAACEQKITPSVELESRTQALMGTFVTLTLPSIHQTHISKSFEKIKEIENALSSYDSNASIYRLNQKHFITYNHYVAEAIQLSQQYYKDTQGYFDITIGSISKRLYHFGEENETLPKQEALQKAILNIDGITLTPHGITTKKELTIDLGGIGKGYAVDKVAKYLREQNISQGTLALSGDIRCLDRCSIALQSPLSEEMFAQVETVKPNVSISTSGTYRRYIKKKEAHHLIDPKAKKPQQNFISVSLFSLGDNRRLDAYATAVSVMPPKVALAFLQKHKDISFILVKSDGKILFNNKAKVVKIQWIDYKEKASIPSSPKNRTINNPMDANLIHPDTTNPKEINTQAPIFRSAAIKSKIDIF